MATKKSSPKKSMQKKTIMTKIAGKAGFLAGELVAGKELLTGMAGNAIESVKSAILHVTASKQSAGKKMVGTAPQKAAKKALRPALKKATSAVAGKKAVAPKKTIKKAAKKVTGRK